MTDVSDNFLGTAGQPFTGDSVFTVTAGSPVFVANHYGVAVQFPGNAQGVMSQPVSPSSAGPLYASAILRFAALPTFSSEIFSARDAGNARTMQIQIGTDGKLKLFNAANTLLATAASAIPIGTDFRVSIILNGTAASTKVFPDATSTTPSVTLTGTIVSTAATALRWGPNLAGGIGTAMDIAWPVLSTTAEPGARQHVYITADVPAAPSPTTVPRTVNFTVHDENFPAGTKVYSMNFADGHTAAYQSGNTFSHTYVEADLASLVAGDWKVTANCKVDTP